MILLFTAFLRYTTDSLVGFLYVLYVQHIKPYRLKTTEWSTNCHNNVYVLI